MRAKDVFLDARRRTAAVNPERQPTALSHRQSRSQGFSMEPAFPRTLRTSQSRARARFRLAVTFFLVMCGRIAKAQAADETLVINEVLITPQAGDKQFIEYLNRGETDLDLFRWWICHQPTSRYYRLLQVPQGTGTPMTPSIVLASGISSYPRGAWKRPADIRPVQTAPERPPMKSTSTHLYRYSCSIHSQETCRSGTKSRRISPASESPT